MGLESAQGRPVSYKVAAALTLISGALMMVGVASPYWHQSADGSTYGGLWSSCKDGASSCYNRNADVTEDWFVAVQVMVSMSLFCAVLCCGAVLFENIFSDVNAPWFSHQFMGLLGGLLGLIGCIVFLAETDDDDDTYATYSWSFYFVFIGAISVFIATLVVIIGGKNLRKSLRLNRPESQISPAPVRRFSQLWAHESSASPEGVRGTLGPDKSRDQATSFSAPKTLMPVYEPGETEQSEYFYD